MKKIIREYESAFSQRFNAKKAFSFWKGRVALYAILKAMGIGPGDEVILPGYTCVMDVNPIMYLGAKPVYVDIEPETFNIDVNLLKDKITPQTRIIIAQHTYGYPCEMDSIMEIAGHRDVIVVEDCCLALGSKYKGQTVGTFGEASYFSMQWNKPFTTGLGGMAITNNQELAEKIESVCTQELHCPSVKEIFMLAAQLVVYRMCIYPRTTALAQSVFRYLTKKGAVVGSSSTDEFEPVMADDFFKGLSVVQAWSGLGQLRKIEKNLAHRRKIAQLYNDMLQKKGWTVQRHDKSVMDPVLVRYPVRILEKDKALDQAAGAGIELGSWFESPLHPIEIPLKAYDYTTGMCPEAEKASRQVVNLPLHPRVAEETVRRTVEFITTFTQAS